jgi:adiponectin receptor
MWAAGIATICFGFPCDYELRTTYSATVRFYPSLVIDWILTFFQTSFSALLCVLLTLTPRFDSPQLRHWRALFYATFGLSSATFVIHGLILYGWELQKRRMSLVWMGWMAAINLSGAMIYAARVTYPAIQSLSLTDPLQIPERWAPRTFDILGASHQIFHIAVMCAAWVHYLGLRESFFTIRGIDHQCSLALERQ